MPTYEYKCEKCGRRFEVRHSFRDHPEVKCPIEGCNGPVHRIFSPPAIIFKGSGFHVNDYGPTGKKKPATPESSPTESEKPAEVAKTGSD